MTRPARAALLMVLWATPALARSPPRRPEVLETTDDPERDFSIDEGFFSAEERSPVVAEDALVVYSATKSPQRIEEAPAIVTVITRQELRAWGYDTVAEVLRHVVGFYLIDDHITPNVGIRGTSGGLRSESGIIKVMIDGHSVAFRSSAGNWLGPELVPLSVIERIEVIRGPASALYGADAFLGVVNVITRSAKSLSGADLAMSLNRAGDHFGGGADFAAGLQRGALDLVLSGRFDTEDRSGLRLPDSSPAATLPSYAGDDRTAHGLTMNSGVVVAKLGYRLSERSQAVATGYLSMLDRGAEFADWTQLASGNDAQGRHSENRISLLQGSADLAVGLGITDTFDLTLDALAFAGGPTSRDRIEVGSDLYFVRRDFGYRGADFDASGRWRPSSSLTLVLASSLTYDDEQLPSILHVLKSAASGLKEGDVRESTSTRQGHRQLINPGALFQTLWTPTRGLSFTGGVRYDHHNVYGSQPSGRLAAVVSPTQGLHLKLLYGSAFKAPSPVLLYGVPVAPGDILGNPSLKPQFVHTFEAEIAYSPIEYLGLSTDVAYNFVQDQAEFTRQGINTVATNVAEVASLSWETQLEAHYKKVLRAYANLALQPRIVRNLGEVGYRARLLGSDNATYPSAVVNGGAQTVLLGHIRLGVEISYYAERRSSDTNTLENGAPYQLGSMTLLGGTLATTGVNLLAQRETTLRVVGRNLLGSTAVAPGFSGFDYPIAPRTLLFQLAQEM